MELAAHDDCAQGAVRFDLGQGVIESPQNVVIIEEDLLEGAELTDGDIGDI